MKSVPRSAAPERAWSPMSKVPPSPAKATTVVSVRFRAASPAAIPEAEAAVLAKVLFTLGTRTGVRG